MTLHTEIHLETEICLHLAGHGWLYSEGDAELYGSCPTGEVSTEDILAVQMSAQANQAGITFVAFTATPKANILESEILVEQASNNTKEQFASSPDLASALMDAIMDALAAHTALSKQALNSEKVRHGIRDVLLGPAQLYEALRARGVGPG